MMKISAHMQSMLSIVILFIASVTMNCLAQAAATNELVSTNVAPNSYVLDDTNKIVAGDKISLRIVEDEDDPKTLSVTDTGEMDAPYIGRVHAEGKTCRQLADEMKAALEKSYYYHATVIIAIDSMIRNHGHIFLVGAVHMPGPQDIPNDEVLTVSKAILRAGGFADNAEEHKVKITRKNGTDHHENKVIVVDVGSILKNGRADLDMPLEPDDLVYIPDRLIRF
jgi:polysaccharide export outer membrane protein